MVLLFEFWIQALANSVSTLGETGFLFGSLIDNSIFLPVKLIKRLMVE